MTNILKLFAKLSLIYDKVLELLQDFSGLAALAIRVFLVPVLWMAGSHKIDFNTLMPYENTVQWFGNPDWGLGLPAPELLAFTAGWTEILGAILLAVGLATRFIAIPLMFTMIVAAVTAHWDNGFQAIADPTAPFANERVEQASVKLVKAKEILKEHGNYSWLTSSGNVVILNNGIEFSVIYFLFLLSLFFSGGGRYFSMDDYIRRWLVAKRSG